ncbi:MAG: M48 family metalloprotease [Actinomycetia bacterium]|nr:M48 family metalloprotease [Actinomycetes bacterium]
MAATAIWLVPTIGVGLGIWLIITNWPSLLGLLLAAPLFLLAYLLRPRLGRLPKHAATVSRGEAPTLFGVIDDIADELDAPPVEVIVVSNRFNASIARVGARRRLVLEIGLPFWTLLSPKQRVALLAHELAHEVNGDPRRGLFVWGAANMLNVWHRLLTPPEERATWGLGELVAKVFMSALAGTVGVARDGFVALGLRSGLRAEYLADLAATQIAGTNALEELLDTTLLDDTVTRILHRGHRDNIDGSQIWAHLRSKIEAIPDHERVRLRVVAQRRHHRTDDSHPPTTFRIRLLELVDHEPTIRISSDDSQRIDHELTPNPN